MVGIAAVGGFVCYLGECVIRMLVLTLDIHMIDNEYIYCVYGRALCVTPLLTYVLCQNNEI